MATVESVREGRGGVYLEVKLRPGGRQDALLGWENGVLKAEVKAPALEMRANRALADLLAEALDLPRSAVEVTKGGKSRSKTVFVSGLTAEKVRQRLAREPASL